MTEAKASAGAHVPGPESRVLTQRVACDGQRAYRWLLDVQRWPQWASGLSQAAFTPDGDVWRYEAADGRRARLRLAPENELGVLDHWVLPEGMNESQEIYVPLRVLAVGPALCEFQFTLLRQPGMDDTAWARDRAWVQHDLAALKDVLEAQLRS